MIMSFSNGLFSENMLIHGGVFDLGLLLLGWGDFGNQRFSPQSELSQVAGDLGCYWMISIHHDFQLLTSNYSIYTKHCQIPNSAMRHVGKQHTKATL